MYEASLNLIDFAFWFEKNNTLYSYKKLVLWILTQYLL